MARDAKIEQKFIKTFFDKNRQERIIWELENDKKREDLFPLWIRIEKYIDPNIRHALKGIVKCSDVLPQWRNVCDVSDNAYVMCADTSLCGMMKTKEAIKLYYENDSIHWGVLIDTVSMSAFYEDEDFKKIVLYAGSGKKP